MATAIIRQDPRAGIITQHKPQSDHFYNLALRGDETCPLSQHIYLCLRLRKVRSRDLSAALSVILRYQARGPLINMTAS